jgi:MFS family permease
VSDGHGDDHGGRPAGLSTSWFYATIAVGGVGLTMTAPITALYAKALGASDWMAALVVSTISISFLAVDLVGSRVVPRIDARSALVGGYALFGVGSFLSALAPNLAVMALARFLQGAAVAFPMGAGFHLALRLAPPGHEGRELARFNTYIFMGFAGGPLVVGLVADLAGGTTGLRWGFAACGSTWARRCWPAWPCHRSPRRSGRRSACPAGPPSPGAAPARRCWPRAWASACGASPR